MTFEEAKKILKKEGFELKKVGRPCSPTIVFTAYESPEICEAMQVVCSASYGISMVSSRFDDRKARLSLELAENSAPIPGSPLSAVEGIKLKWKDNRNTSENPALKESASQFNDALLEEQAKEIKCIKEKNLRLGREIARLNKNIYKKNMKIEELRKESSRHLRGKIKMFGENVDLEQMLKDKDAVLSDVAEELRLSKIREKNLTEVSQKYMKENEELKKKLAAKIVDKIDAQVLKSAESALAYKEKEIAEKDEVIADLGKELAEAKKLNTAKILDINAKCMRAARESINDVFESYAAKYAKSTLDDLKEKAYESFNAKACNLGLVGSKDGNGIIDPMIGVDIAEEGADLSGVFVLCGKDFIDALKKVKDVWQE